MDIRSYFTTIRQSKTSDGSASDVTKLKSKDRTGKKRTRVAILSDSDSDDEIKPKSTTPSKKPKIKSPAKKTAPSDFFGSKTVNEGSKQATTIARKLASSKTAETVTRSSQKHGKSNSSKTSSKETKILKGKGSSIARMVDDVVIIPEGKKNPNESDDLWSDIDDESFCQIIEQDEKHADPKFNAVLEQLDNETTPITRISPRKSKPATPTKTKTEAKKEISSTTRVTPRKDNSSKSPEKKKVSKASPNKIPLTQPTRVSPVPSKITASPPTKIKTKPASPKPKHSESGRDRSPRKGKKKLDNITFVFTGNLETLDRDEAKQLVVDLGGRVVSALSGKVNYLVCGDEPGVSKSAKAEKLPNCELIDEDEFYTLIGRSRAVEEPMDREPATNSPKKMTETADSPSKRLKKESPHKVLNSQSKPSSTSRTDSKIGPRARSDQPDISAETLLWVDKYKPASMSRIVGQTGDRSNAKKLLNWLRDWHKHKKLGTMPAKSFGGWGGGGGDRSGAGHRAALLSGPPGIGKTTTATLVCKEAGFSYFELNASDTRNKSSIHTTVGEALGNKTLANLSHTNNIEDDRHHCIIMDEVDGMAGNEDRGGMGELLSLIKTSQIPVICICNDRQSQKIRSLANHCFDLRFQKPTTDQIKAAMMSVCYKEGIKLDPKFLHEIIESSNHDIRQVIHNLSVFGSKRENPKANPQSNLDKKDFKLDPFAACRLALLDSEETRNYTIKDKTDLFFYDYNLHPLYIHENYIHSKPHKASSGHQYARAVAKASIHIASGDLVSKSIRMENWSLLPMQAMFSSVLPGEAVKGHLSARIDFPKWLGKYSSTNKYRRICSELTQHMSLGISGSSRDVVLDYLPALKTHLTTPLIKHGKDGITQIVDFMNTYDIIKEDYDNILEMSQWPGRQDFKSQVDSKIRAALTRQYNSTPHRLHYASDAGVSRKRVTVRTDVEVEEYASDESDDDDDDEAAVNALRVNKKPTKRSTKTASKNPSAKKSPVEKKPRAPAKRTTKKK